MNVQTEFVTLVVVLMIDYFTGVCVACINEKISSKIGFKGICRKVMVLLLVALTMIVDVIFLEDNRLMSHTVIAFYIINESISVLENTATIGIPLPKALVKLLGTLKEDNHHVERH